MNATLAATARQQCGVFSALQARRAGVGKTTLYRWITSGLCRSPEAGVYAVTAAPVTSEQSMWVAVLAAGEPCALAGMAAAWLHGLVDVAPARAQIVLPAARGPRTRTADVRRVGAWSSLALGARRGLPGLGIRDTVVTAAGEASTPALLALIQAGVFEYGLDPFAVRASLRRGLPGGARLRKALESYLRGHDSIREADVFDELKRLGVPPDHCNVVLEAFGRRTTPVDGYYELGVAYDYNGRSAHASRRARQRDAWKAATVTSLGVTLLPLRDADLRDGARLRDVVVGALAARRTPAAIRVVHPPGRSCVCGHFCERGRAAM